MRYFLTTLLLTIGIITSAAYGAVMPPDPVQGYGETDFRKDAVTAPDYHHYAADTLEDVWLIIVDESTVEANRYHFFVYKGKTLLGDFYTAQLPTGLETVIVEVDTEAECRKNYEMVRTYRAQLTAVRTYIMGMSNTQFKDSVVQWNSGIFKGTKAEYLVLVNKELETRYLGITVYGSNSDIREGSRDQAHFQARIREFIGGNLESVTSGGVAISPTVVFIAHGVNGTTLLDELGNINPTNARMQQWYQQIADRTNAPVLNSTCYKNHLQLREKITISEGKAKAVPSAIKGIHSEIEVDTLGSRKNVTAWRPLIKETDIDKTRIDKRRKVFRRGSITNEKTTWPARHLRVERNREARAERIRNEREELVP